ncbi:helix-turn-helix transcriptional regulator [Spirochaeta cellobiosiphila]|uniref:helix-turn-helix transcriptional regulator n=1 Tax=Spirochaeta cellobiosiphila TaxID=504483 RepID=UPI00040D390D|nr:helix-turn-helix transcriptional regulator [Spirochaeta cellobiosiphila]
MLSENDWKNINQILLELYSIEQIEVLTDRLFKMFRVLVPHTQGFYFVYDDENNIDMMRSRFVNMDKKVQEKYLKSFYDIDYLNLIFEFILNTATFRDTDILEENIRKNTDFYKGFLRAENIPYGCGIVLFKNSRLIGIINLFRSGEMGNFTDREMTILDELALHLENILYKLTLKQERKHSLKLNSFYEQYQLSKREQEVVALVREGRSNSEIEDLLGISLSTVKKHMYNIYNKIEVCSRTQLLAELIKTDY